MNHREPSPAQPLVLGTGDLSCAATSHGGRCPWQALPESRALPCPTFEDLTPKNPKPYTVHHSAQVRQTALDYDGKILLAACDDGTIWRYERRDAKPDSNGRKDASMDEADP